MKKILILASNPRQDLNLDHEIRDLRRIVETPRQGEDFELVDELAVRVGDLQELMFKHRPQIVHFCGHGGGEQGLVFESDKGREHRVRTEALSDLFRLFSSNVECVLLNACYSDEQADAIVTHINYVIGMNQEIRDDAAIAFAKGFYRALGYACAIKQAYEFGCNAIQLEISGSSVVRSALSEAQRKMKVIDVVTNTSIPEHLKPILRKKVTLTPDASSISQEKRAEIQLDIDKRLATDAKNKGNSQPEQNLPSVKIEKFSFDVLTVDEKGKENRRTTKEAELVTEDLGDGVTLEMVKIPGGTFLMGTEEEEIKKLNQIGEPKGLKGWLWNLVFSCFNQEKPLHKVDVPSFWMGRYPITQAQWRIVAGWESIERELNPDPSYFKDNYEGIERSTRPVEQVSWEEAVEFCARLSQKTNGKYRLPTEAEWEYACRAGTITPFHFGETISTQLANYRGTDWEYEGKIYPGNYGNGLKGIFREQTTPVGYFQVANAFGLYDMHGNVWEWCADHWHDSYDGAPRDGSAWVTGGNPEYRVLRGGSWFNTPAYCRSTYRLNLTPAVRSNNFGFRVVCAVLPGLF